MPVIVSGQVIAALNLTWTRRAAGAALIVSEHLEDLRQGAAEVAAKAAGDAVPQP